MRTGILLIAIVLGFAYSDARAGEPAPEAHGSGISVVGVASAPVRPEVVEISATLSAEAELANDARVKERDARQRVVDALTASSPGVAVEFRGISVNPVFDAGAMAMQRQQQLMIQNGIVVQMQQNGAETARKFGVTEQVRLVLKDADKMETPKLVETVLRLIDAARASGLQVGQLPANNLGTAPGGQAPMPPLVVCKTSDSPAARGQVYKAAMQDARKKAEQLAEVAGVKVGKVTDVRELDAPAPGADPASVSAQLNELSLNVRLSVQFEIVR